VIKIDNSTRKKLYVSPEIVVELDLEARAGGSAPGGDPRYNRPGESVPSSDPDALPTGG
jgi:hypothetical protein